MEIELKQFRNGKPVLPGKKSSDIESTILQLSSQKKYDKVLELAEAMEDSKEKYMIAVNALLHLRNWKKLLVYCELGLSFGEESQFYHLKGKAQGKLGDHKKQIQLIAKAIKINPYVAAYYRNLGAGYYSLKQYHQAIKQHLKAIDIEPDNPINYHNAGSAYFRIKQYNEAKSYFDQAIKRSPTLALSYAWKGDCFKEENNIKEASQCYERAFQLSNNPLYLKEKESLSKLLSQKGNK